MHNNFLKSFCETVLPPHIQVSIWMKILEKQIPHHIQVSIWLIILGKNNFSIAAFLLFRARLLYYYLRILTIFAITSIDSRSPAVVIIATAVAAPSIVIIGVEMASCTIISARRV